MAPEPVQDYRRIEWVETHCEHGVEIRFSRTPHGEVQLTLQRSEGSEMIYTAGTVRGAVDEALKALT